MKNPIEIKALALERLGEAEILYQNKKFDGAFYLAEYSAELMLKAKICIRMGVPNLFDEDDKVLKSIPGISEIRKSIKTHNLIVLLILSGLKEKFDADKSTNQHLFKANSLLFSNWNENSRYKPCGFMKSTVVHTLILLLKDENGLLQWIEQN